MKNDDTTQAWSYLTDEQLEDAFDAVLLARRAHEPTLSLEEVKQIRT
jgi:hypothetical protein